MISLNINEIVEAVKGTIIQCNENQIYDTMNIKNIATDSRKIKDNDQCLFIPLKGENFDGHDYIEQCLEKGAIASLTEKENIDSHNKILIKVSDTRKALRDLAEYYRSLFNIPVVAVTGSVGKTSCKEMIASVLSQKYKVLKTKGNFNNEIGLPLTIFNLEKEHEVLVIEMGMNHFGEIRNLAKIAKPNIAVITNIGVSHIENLGSREGILKAKSEIFTYMTKEDVAVLNGDDKLLTSLIEQLPCKVNTYGVDEICDYKGLNIQNAGWEGIKADIQILQKNKIEVATKVVGEHMIYNVLPAVAVGSILKVSEQGICAGISQYIPEKMRLDIIHIGDSIKIINDAYNASPDSMKAALNTLENLESRGRKVAILGDMFEMGNYSETGHKEVGKYIAHKNIDYLICIGNYAKHIKQLAIKNGMDSNKVEYYSSKEELYNHLDAQIIEKDVVLVKASRGMKLEEVIEKLKEVKG